MIVPATFLACSSKPDPGAGRGGPPALPVRTAVAQAKDVTYKIQALGSLEAEEMVQVTAEVEGAVAQVLFHEGDRVTPDTILLRIDPDRYRLEAERAEATLKRALADQHRSEADLKRREDLARDNLVAAEELTRSRQETERLTAETAGAKAARDIALQNLRRAEVRAKRAGIINTKAVDTGQFVRYGAVLATIVDTRRLRLRFKVSEAESLHAGEGQTVSFRVSAVGSQEFTGTIYHVSGVADLTSRQVEVLGWVNNPGVLKPGFFAEVTLASESRKGALVVPEAAIQASEQGFVAYAVEQGKARVRRVEVGLRIGDGTVEVLRGLKPGEVVVTEGSDRLADGIVVRDAAAKPTGKPEGGAGK